MSLQKSGYKLIDEKYHHCKTVLHVHRFTNYQMTWWFFDLKTFPFHFTPSEWCSKALFDNCSFRFSFASVDYLGWISSRSFPFIFAASLTNHDSWLANKETLSNHPIIRREKKLKWIPSINCWKLLLISFFQIRYWNMFESVTIPKRV